MKTNNKKMNVKMFAWALVLPGHWSWGWEPARMRLIRFLFRARRRW